MGKPRSSAPPTRSVETASASEWQSENTTRNNRTRNGIVVVMGLVAALILGVWFWQMQDVDAQTQVAAIASNTPVATPSKPIVAVASETTLTPLSSMTKVVPTRRSAAIKLPTPTPERNSILSLLRVEQVSPIQLGQLMKVRVYWRVGAVPSVGTHQGMFTLDLIGPTGDRVAKSDVASEGPMRGYRVGSVIVMEHSLQVPLQANFGEYTLIAGVADMATGERWPTLMDGQANADYRLKALQFMLPRKGWGPMMWPVQSTAIQQGVGAQHAAIDIVETEGQPVFAALRGCVVAGDSDQDKLDYGDRVEIKSDTASMDVRVRYSFVNGLRVKVGDCVMPGDAIGEVAAAPSQTRGASRLRVEVLANGQAQNPWDSFSPITLAPVNDAARVPLPKRYPLTLNAMKVEPLQPKAGEPIKITWWFSGSANHVAVKLYDSDSGVDEEYLHSTTLVDSQRGEMTVRGINTKHAPAAIGLLVDHTLLAFVPLGATANDAAIQSFEHGSMIWLRGTQEIYVLYEGGAMQSFIDHFVDGQAEETTVPPPEGKLQPQRGFGWVWRTYSNVRERLGWALQAEQGYRACVRWLIITDVATKQPIYVSDPHGQVYQLGSEFGLWQYSPGLLGQQPC